MRIIERDDIPAATPMISVPVSIPIDNTPYSPTAMFALKLYVFGGLAFMIGVVLTAIGFWIWTVVIKGEYANSPPWLDLHPERMREKEKARIERLKQQKAEKMEERRRRSEQSFSEKFTPPPLRFMQKEGRNRSSSLPIKPFTPVESANSPKPRKSSLSSSPGSKGGKRVSWASSTATLDVNGNTSEKPIDDKEANFLPRKRALSHSSLKPIPAIRNISGFDNDDPFSDAARKPTAGTVSRRRASSFSSLQPIPNLSEFLRPIPQARSTLSSTSAAIEPRSRRGPEMIAATTPEVVSRWATSNYPLSSDPVDPLEVSEQYRRAYNGR